VWKAMHMLHFFVIYGDDDDDANTDEAEKREIPVGGHRIPSPGFAVDAIFSHHV